MVVMTAKAVAFITRPARDASGLELLVFSHPMAGVQLPAGSLFDDEDPLAGCIREAWEETGLAGVDLEVRGPLGTWVEPDTALTRHAFHFHCVRDTPDEWWVITPDGGGLCWRCWWTKLDGTEPLHPFQRRWLDRVRHRVDDDVRRVVTPRPTLPAPFGDRNATQVFAAPPIAGAWFAARWEPAQHIAESMACVHALCLTDAGDSVLVAHPAVDQRGEQFLSWGPPGGTIEEGETPDGALAREIVEEACAAVREIEWLGSTRLAALDADGNVTRVEIQGRALATVELAAWSPQFEMVERRLVPVTDTVGELPYWRHPVNEQWLVAGIERARARRG